MSFPAPIFPNSESALKECRNFFAVTSPLGALAIVVFSWRIYTKLNPAYRMGWDDWCMVFAFVCPSNKYIRTNIPVSQEQDYLMITCSFLLSSIGLSWQSLS